MDDKRSSVDVPATAMAEAILSHRHRDQSTHPEDGIRRTSISASKASRRSSQIHNEKSQGVLEAEDSEERPSTSTLEEKDVVDQTHRRLKPRHIQLIGIGGTIGTALFVAIGRGLTRGGPGSLFLAFTIWFVLPSICRSNHPKTRIGRSDKHGSRTDEEVY